MASTTEKLDRLHARRGECTVCGKPNQAGHVCDCDTIKKAAETLAVRAVEARTTKVAFNMPDFGALGSKAKGVWDGLGTENQKTIGYGLGGAALGGTIGAMSSKRRDDGSSDWMRNAALGALAGGAAGAGGHVAMRSMYDVVPPPQVQDPRTVNVNRMTAEHDNTVNNLPGGQSTHTGTHTPQSYEGSDTPFLAPGNHGLTAAGGLIGGGTHAGLNYLRGIPKSEAQHIHDPEFWRAGWENDKGKQNLKFPLDKNAPGIDTNPNLYHALDNWEKYRGQINSGHDGIGDPTFSPESTRKVINDGMTEVYGAGKYDPLDLHLNGEQVANLRPDLRAKMLDYTRATGRGDVLKNLAEHHYDVHRAAGGTPRMSWGDLYNRVVNTEAPPGHPTVPIENPFGESQFRLPFSKTVVPQISNVESANNFATTRMGHLGRSLGRSPALGAVAGAGLGAIADSVIGTNTLPDDRGIDAAIKRLTLENQERIAAGR